MRVTVAAAGCLLAIVANSCAGSGDTASPPNDSDTGRSSEVEPGEQPSGAELDSGDGTFEVR